MSNQNQNDQQKRDNSGKSINQEQYKSNNPSIKPIDPNNPVATQESKPTQKPVDKQNSENSQSGKPTQNKTDHTSNNKDADTMEDDEITDIDENKVTDEPDEHVAGNIIDKSNTENKNDSFHTGKGSL